MTNSNVTIHLEARQCIQNRRRVETPIGRKDLTPEQCINNGKTRTSEPLKSVKKSKRFPYAKQTEELGGEPYYTNNNKKKPIHNGNLFREKITTTTMGSGEKDHRTIRQDDKEIRLIPPHGKTQQTFTRPPRKRRECGMLLP